MPTSASVIPDRAGVLVTIDFPGQTRVKVDRIGSSGFQSTILAGDSVQLAAGFGSIEDYEAPLDMAVYYIISKVIPVGSAIQTTNEVTVPADGLTWLKDPGYPSMNMTVPVVTSIEALLRPSKAGIFPILDRPNPIVVTGKRQSALGELILHTLTSGERRDMTALLARGTTLLLQTPAEHEFGSQYIHVADVVESRVGLATEPARRWQLPFVIVDRPEGLSAPSAINRTWQAVKDAYPTWAGLKASGLTWQQLLETGP
jgi:hypothetical protein